MTTETPPFWKDPVVHFMAFGLATGLTGFLLFHWMVEHLWMPTMAALDHSLSPLFTAPVETIVTFFPALHPLPFFGGPIIILFGTGFATLVVVTVVVFFVFAPYIVSYAFWRHLVYDRLYKPYMNGVDRQ